MVSSCTYVSKLELHSAVNLVYFSLNFVSPLLILKGDLVSTSLQL